MTSRSATTDRSSFVVFTISVCSRIFSSSAARVLPMRFCSFGGGSGTWSEARACMLMDGITIPADRVPIQVRAAVADRQATR